MRRIAPPYPGGVHRCRASQASRAGYTYGKAAYVNNSTLVTITCPDHGDFPQTPGNHLAGHGCPVCGGVKVGTADGFIAAARGVHPDANYNYGKVDYKTRRTPVIITCVRHGDFEQEPTHHLRGQGCRECGRERQVQSATLTREEFIAAAQERHPGKGYGYAKLTYVNNHTLVAARTAAMTAPQQPAGPSLATLSPGLEPSTRALAIPTANSATSTAPPRP